MLICHDQRSGTGCGAENPDAATQCRQCHRSLRFALHLHDPGTLIRNYRVLRIIGRGGFGAVYEAEDTQHAGMRVALKETFNPDSIHGFQREFTTLSRLRHDHLPAYHTMFEEQGNGYLVMEFVPGQSLDDVLQRKQGPLVEGQVLGYAMQICDVLTYLHRQTPPLVHRDIKPANIRLTPDGLIKLVDFGLVKAGIGTTVMSQRALSPAYAPIEQWGIDAEHTTPRSDIYSLGATLYALLTGQTPIAAPQRLATTPDPLIHPQQRNPHLSPHVAGAVMQAMALRAEDRFVEIISFKQALLGQTDLPAVTDTTRPLQTTPALASVRRPGLLAVGMVVFLLVILSIGGYLFSSGILRPATDEPLPSQVVSAPTATPEAEAANVPAATNDPTAQAEQATVQAEQIQATIAAGTLATMQAYTAVAREAEAATIQVQAVEATVAAQVQRTVAAQPLAPTDPPASQSDQLQRARQWPRAFADNFAENTGTWYTGNYSTRRIGGTISIGSGVHRWQVTANENATWWLRPTITPRTDFYLETAMQRTDGPIDSSYGVIFRLQEVDGFSYYRFRINDTQMYEVSRVAGGDEIGLIDWTATMAVEPGTTNQLTVIGEGNQFTFFINDQFVDTLTDNALARGQVGIIIGLQAGDAATFETTEFALRTP